MLCWYLCGIILRGYWFLWIVFPWDIIKEGEGYKPAPSKAEPTSAAGEEGGVIYGGDITS